MLAQMSHVEATTIALILVYHVCTEYYTSKL